MCGHDESVARRAGALLLVRRADTLNWELPGGKVELGESATHAVVREVFEESGIVVRQQFALCFHALPMSGRPRPDLDETIGADWFALADLDDLDIHPSVRLRIDHAVHHPDTVDIG
jgi:8-oxo-dGTP pyrophosphatase MutT (NUDIX family)